MGVEVSLLSTRKPSPLSSHDFRPAAFAETHYLFPPAGSDLAAWMAHGLPGLSQARAYLRGLEASNLANRLRLHGLLISAINLVQWARRERIDHIHAHSCADAAHVLALARRAGGPPYSLTLHGDLAVYGTDHRSKMADAAFVCVVGSHLRHQVIEKADVSGDRVWQTFLGVETSELAGLGTDRSYTPGSLHMASVARLHPGKGHIHALAAMQAGLKAGLDLHFTIAGDGPYRDALLSRIYELKLETRATMTGTISEAEKYQLLSKADAFVLPSTGLGESWPSSVIEAMGAGLPVIASVIGATPEMITSGEDGFLVPKGDEAALLEKITLLACDVETRRRISGAARSTAVRRFDVAVTAGVLRDAVRASLGAGR
jgi:glycosyltransferase involved in cell wall biosynthesis